MLATIWDDFGSPKENQGILKSIKGKKSTGNKVLGQEEIQKHWTLKTTETTCVKQQATGNSRSEYKKRADPKGVHIRQG